MNPADRTARRGRPDDGGDRRARILTTATRLFAEHGFDAVSLRQVAREATVDPALVHHYFGGKEELFEAAVSLPVDPDGVLAGLEANGPEDRGRFLAHAVISLWEGPQRPVLVAFFRSTIGSARRTRLLRAAVQRRILARITVGLPFGPGERELRASLAATQAVGFMVARYLVGIEPLASLERAQAEAFLGAALQRILMGPLPGPDPDGGPGGASESASGGGVSGRT